MRIATWNLDRCRPRPSPRATRLSALMASVNADIWVLTETFVNFPPEQNYRLVAHSASAPDRAATDGECWVAIWVRAHSVAEPVAMTADLERVAAIRLGSTVIVGTVLPWLTDDRHQGVRGEAAFRARLAEQSADWLRLRGDNDSLCVAGDFNQDLLPTGHCYGSNGGREALQAALSSAGLRCLTSGADDPLMRSPGLASIDHISVAGLEPTGHPRSSAWPVPGELPKGLTDHYGVWADLRVA